MGVEISQILNPGDCADSVHPHPGNFLQSKFWGLFKSRTGWDSYACTMMMSDGVRLEFLALRRKVGKLFTFLYVPFGLGELEQDTDRWIQLSSIGHAVSASLGGSDLFVRFDLPWTIHENSADRDGHSDDSDAIGGSEVVKGIDVQVPDTVILDLSKNEEDILAGMKPKWRYNIRLSEKKGILVSDEGEEALSEFMQLYQETARRDKIAIHPLSYYRELFYTVSQLQEETQRGGRNTSACPRIALYIARHEGEALAGIIVLELGDKATYLYGASSDKKRNLMPTYALQWHAIQSAKQRGAISYDFFGIPPMGADPSHPMAGLYLFKTGFGGDIVHRRGAYDVMLHPAAYHVFRTSEALRLLWHKRIKKGFWRLFRVFISS